MKICGVYIIRNISNQKVLIGSSYDVHHRFAQHKYKLRNNIHNNPHFQSAWNKYGESSFVFDILEACEESILIEKEDYYINHFNALNRNKGYNFNLASRRTQNEETKEKLRKYRLGKKMSDEQKKKLSIAHQGKNCGPRPKEWRENISKALTGKKMSELQRRNWRLSIKNRSPERRKEITELFRKVQLDRINALKQQSLVHL